RWWPPVVGAVGIPQGRREWWLCRLPRRGFRRDRTARKLREDRLSRQLRYADRSAQPDDGDRHAGRSDGGRRQVAHALRVPDDRPRSFQGRQRYAGASCGRPVARARFRTVAQADDRQRTVRPAGRRRIRHRPSRRFGYGSHRP
ncbi:hypothetical protein OY671_013024, partial [Metschnikowia pulcherrima]